MARLIKIFFVSLFFIHTHAFAESGYYDKQELFSVFNDYRINANLAPLQNHTSLQAIADKVAYSMARNANILQSEAHKSFFNNIDLNISHYRFFASYGNMPTQDLLKHLIEKNSSQALSQKYDYTSIGTYEQNGTRYVIMLLAREVNDPQSEIQKVITLTNQARRANGIYNDVLYDEELSKAALKRAKEIVRLFSHTRPNGKAFHTVFAEFGIAYQLSGENLAFGQADANEVVQGWMDSPGHRANILTRDFDGIGVGLFFYQGQAYWTQLFTQQAP